MREPDYEVPDFRDQIWMVLFEPDPMEEHEAIYLVEDHELLRYIYRPRRVRFRLLDRSCHPALTISACHPVCRQLCEDRRYGIYMWSQI